MNAPHKGSQLEPGSHSDHEISLDDKWTLERGRAFMTGTQALIRLPMMQRERDLKAGLNRPATLPATVVPLLPVWI